MNNRGEINILRNW